MCYKPIFIRTAVKSEVKPYFFYATIPILALNSNHKVGEKRLPLL